MTTQVPRILIAEDLEVVRSGLRTILEKQPGFEVVGEAANGLEAAQAAGVFLARAPATFSISRTSITWGVPIPWDPRHVTYVWYDALINYATAIGYGQDDVRFATWWPAVHHLIGKEIVRFHCVWWPAMCLAAGIDPPAHIFVSRVANGDGAAHPA